MVTRAQLDKIGARLEALAVAFDVGQPVYVWQEADESDRSSVTTTAAEGTFAWHA